MKMLTEIYPRLPYDANDDGDLPLHWAGINTTTSLSPKITTAITTILIFILLQLFIVLTRTSLVT
jgi:hypothetical protein